MRSELPSAGILEHTAGQVRKGTSSQAGHQRLRSADNQRPAARPWHAPNPTAGLAMAQAADPA